MIKKIALSTFLSLSFHSISSPLLNVQLTTNKAEVCNDFFVAYQKEYKQNANVDFRSWLSPSFGDGTQINHNNIDTFDIPIESNFSVKSAPFSSFKLFPSFKYHFQAKDNIRQELNITHLESVNNLSILYTVKRVFSQSPNNWQRTFYIAKRDNIVQYLNSITVDRPFSIDRELSEILQVADISFPFEHQGNAYYIKDNNKVIALTEALEHEVVCEVEETRLPVLISLNALNKLAHQSIMTKGNPMLMGSWGSPYFVIKKPFEAYLKTPSSLKVKGEGGCDKNAAICARKKQVDNILALFGNVDAWSHRELLTLKNHMADAQLQVAHFYMSYHKYDKDKAHFYAQTLIYQFLGRLLTPYQGYMDLKAGSPQYFKAQYLLNDLSAEEFAQAAAYKNWFNKTHLMLASHFNDLDTVNALIAAGTDINAVTFIDEDDEYSSSDAFINDVKRLNRSALTYAAENASLEVINALITAGADKKLLDSRGNDLSFYFAKNPRPKVAALATEFKLLKGTKTSAQITASFDCKLAKSKQEKAICSSAGLALYDRELAAAYKRLRNTEHADHVRQTQRLWLKNLRQHSKGLNQKETQEYLKAQYRARIRALHNLISIH
ncbi:hypothetical protein [Pseudoalteromonas umbrosa]|uniref:hypothetical protein n=1 Tax=Pseudoalteromonas umbrosa TaxID=3048489 RepID=UPI0024C35F15|nr:hypothetical protein [Pseudoalteromonas sp. B95]MDK1286428.1 hypothetical protein [Pseudoalteromonas sp. B95]